MKRSPADRQRRRTLYDATVGLPPESLPSPAPVHPMSAEPLPKRQEAEE